VPFGIVEGLPSHALALSRAGFGRHEIEFVKEIDSGRGSTISGIASIVFAIDHPLSWIFL
jgi:hypothetical protein